MSNSLQPHRWQPTRLPGPWDSPGKNPGVGCDFLLQYMKMKSESEIAQSRPTLNDPMDCSLPGSSVHGIFQARVLERGAIAFSMGRLSAVEKNMALVSLHLNSGATIYKLCRGQSCPSEKAICLFIHLINTLRITVVSRNKIVSKKTQSPL